MRSVRKKGEAVRFRTLEVSDGRLAWVTWEIVADGWGGFSERRAVEIAPLIRVGEFDWNAGALP